MNNQSNDLQLNPELRERTAKLLLYVGIGSIVMAFAGLTSAYVVTQGSGTALQLNRLPSGFYFSTAAIMLSSISMFLAVKSAQQNQLRNITVWLIITLILGITFSYMQYIAWGELYNNKIYFAGKQSNAAGSFLYVITGLHLAHLAGGVIYLLHTIAKSFNGSFTAENHLKLKLCSIYWHFLDLLWIYLFIFLLNFR